jgi:hypothetical protein
VHDEPGLGDPHVDERLDLEPVAVDMLVRYRAFTSRFSARFPQRRISVMSELPPPCAKREPLTKSAPLQRAATKRGISAASADPSASRVTMTAPVHAAKPAARAFPFPRPLCTTTLTSGRRLRATSTVPSVELPSTTITS